MDSNGNRTTHVNGGTTFTYTNPTTSNKTSAVSGLKTYTYDAAGNITSDGVNALVYDDRGRLKSFGSVNYKINGLGQRLQKDSSGSKVRFMYNENGNLMGEYDGSDATPIEHVWLNGQIIGAIKPNAGATDMFYVYTDQIGAPRAITTNAGTPVIAWTWDNNDPFGANTANAISLTYNVRLPGQYFDLESGMHHNYFRDYDPAVGRYMTSDPAGLKAGINTFAYVESNPLIKIDPQGLASFSGFPTSEEAKMRAAVEAAKKKVQDCKLPDCLDNSDRQAIIDNLERATYEYRSSFKGCGLTSSGPFWKTIYVGPNAFSNFAQCCDLSSTLAHEANHMGRLLSGRSSEAISLQLEETCFGCKNQGAK